MPIELGIWKLGKKLEKVSFSTIESEQKLEDTLAQDISILSPGLMLLGRLIATAHGKFIDLLAMDADGNLSISITDPFYFAAWAYEQTATINGEVWICKGVTQRIPRNWQSIFDSQ